MPASNYSISYPSTTHNVTITASNTSGNNSVLSSMKKIKLVVLCGRVKAVVKGVGVACKARLGKMLRKNVRTFRTACAKKFEKAAEKIKPDENE